MNNEQTQSATTSLLTYPLYNINYSSTHNDITQPLMEHTEEKKADWKDSILLKTVAFGLHGFFFAGHLVLNGKFLTSLDEDGAAASSLMSTYQSVIIGGSVGCLLGTGLDFGTAVGKKKFIVGGDIARTATIFSTGLGILATGSMLLSKAIFPALFSHNPAKIASDFFLTYSLSPISLLFIVVGSQISFQAGDWYIAPASMCLVLTLSGCLSYGFGFGADMGALGVGLGGSLGSTLVALGLGFWFFLRDTYTKYDLFKLTISDFGANLKSLWGKGWRLAAQRLTEWGNLFIITLVLGARNENGNVLSSLNPALLYLVLFGTSEQGCAQAVGMMIKKNKGSIIEIFKECDIDKESKVMSLHKTNQKAIILSNIFGIALNTLVAGTFYLARDPLTNFFLESDDEGVIELAQDLLWKNMLGLIPDGLGIIGAGGLRGWDDLLYPTILRFIFMTVCAIPIALGLGYLFEDDDDDDAKLMIYMRISTMLVSAGFILKRCYNKINEDKKELQSLLTVFQSDLYQPVNEEKILTVKPAVQSSNENSYNNVHSQR